MKTRTLVYIKPNTSYAAALGYTIRLIAQNQDWDLKIVNRLEKDVSIKLVYDNDFQLLACWDFLDLDKPKTPIDTRIHNLIRTQKSANLDLELLPAIFFLVNCCQEVNPTETELDKFGRFKYRSSWQYRSDRITENVVQKYIDLFVSSIGLSVVSRKTQIFISHDVDFLYGSKKEDLVWAARNWRVDVLMKIVFNELIRRPHWRNIDKVMAINNEYDIRSTFFWLVNKGLSENNILNADYHFHKENDLLQSIDSHNGFSGLHKSDSTMTLDDELIESKQEWNINRYHYLKFQSHKDWRLISDSNIELDCSLGFAEHHGFRNSYGLPFQPFDLDRHRLYDFVEAPLHVMDATFLHYSDTGEYNVANEVIAFIDKNRTNCVLSILWHNNYCTDFAYQPFLIAYKEILAFISDNQFSTVTPDTIIADYQLDWRV